MGQFLQDGKNVCNIVIFWGDPSPPIRDYVIYGQPLITIIIDCICTEYITQYPTQCIDLDVFHCIVTKYMMTRSTQGEYAMLMHVSVNVMGVKYNDRRARMIVDICTAWVATWAVQIWQKLCTCRFDRGNKRWSTAVTGRLRAGVREHGCK